MARSPLESPDGYGAVLSGIVELLEAARHAATRSLNAVMTATYWEVGRRIVEFEQGGEARAKYGQAILENLATDLQANHGRGFSKRNLEYMRRFYRTWPELQEPALNPSASATHEIAQTASAQSVRPPFPLPWSHYVALLGVKNDLARQFYEREALAAGWTNRQLKRQISTQFYERAALSRKKAAMLRKGEHPEPEESVPAEEDIKNSPFVLEFLDLKDEYSESDLEAALIHKLEEFLLELGSDFAFIGRQRRLRIGESWFRVDLLFFHRRLRCLVVIDLKLDKFTHADAGQMNVYLNYAREHWMLPGENPPVGLILCASEDEPLAKYALEGLPNKVLAAEYRTTLPDEKLLAAELKKTRRLLESGQEVLESKAKLTSGDFPVQRAGDRSPTEE